MRRALRRIAILLLALPVLLVVVAGGLANTDAGRRLIERQTLALTGGMVRLQGLSGRFPDALRAERIDVADARGVYLLARDVVLDWSPRGIWHGSIAIDRLAAGDMVLSRWPADDVSAPDETSPAAGDGGFALPVPVDVGDLAVARLSLGAAVLGTTADFAVTGQGRYRRSDDGSAHLALRRLDKPGTYRADAVMTASAATQDGLTSIGANSSGPNPSGPNPSGPNPSSPNPSSPNPSGPNLSGANPSGVAPFGVPRFGATPLSLTARLTVQEPNGGLLAQISGLPDLGPISVEAAAKGPPAALAVTLALSAGDLRADGAGTVDLVHQTASASLHADAPAMRPAPDLTWQGARVDARLNGPLARPAVSGTVRLTNLRAYGTGIAALAAEVTGDAGAIDLRATAEGLVLPGPHPDLLAGAPLTIRAALQVDHADWPARFSLHHALLDLQGTAHAGEAPRAQARLTLPDLAPLSAAAGMDIAGRASLDLDVSQLGATIVAAVKGAVAVTGGADPLPGLIGEYGAIDLAIALNGAEVSLRHLSVSGKAMAADAAGALRGGMLSLDWSAALTDLGVLQPQITGRLEAHGHAAGGVPGMVQRGMAQAPPGHASSGQASSGQASSGQAPPGLAPHGQAAPGQASPIASAETPASTGLSVIADATADIAAHGYASGRVRMHLDASGLPEAAKANMTADGTLLDAPLALALTAEQTAGAMRLAIGNLAWKSLQAAGTVTLPDRLIRPSGAVDAAAPGTSPTSTSPTSTSPTSTSPTSASPTGTSPPGTSPPGTSPPGALGVGPIGSLRLRFGRLADLQPVLNRPIQGSAEAVLSGDDRSARTQITVAGLVLPNVMQVGKAVLEATVSDPVAQPRLDASLAVSDVSGGVVHGASGRLAAAGRLSALAVTATADAPSLAGAAARLISTATINAQTRSLTLNRLEAVWKGQTLRLLAPARIDVADGVAIDSLRLGYRQAVLTLSGRAPSAPASGTATKTALDLTATLRDLPIDSAAIVDPALAADGHIEGDLRLTGSVERPEGRLALTASGVHLRQGPGQGLPPARVATTVTFHGDAAAVDARMTAGKTHLSATGSVPLNDTEPMTIRADGQIDLLMLDPLIAADGRRARGSAVLDARIGGSLAQPVVTGSLALRDGDIVDYSLGGHIADLAGLIEAEGNTIRIVRLTGRAGAGTMGVTGTVGLGGTMPVDLHVTADDAKPLSSDLLSATIDQDLTLRGDIKGHLEIGGSVHVRRADIRIPDTLPPSIAVLPVRLPGAAPPPPAPFHGAIALNLTLDAPQRVFVRGRGLDAELGGTMQIRGTVEQPQPDGGLHLRHGTVSIIGTTLTFTDGSVSFSGAGIADPTLFFVATSTNAAMTARLTVSGTAKNPEIALSSTPALPQDEVLAELLFNTSAAKLSPLQLAQVASALASLSGATAGFDPLNTMRTALGLDRLSVGSNAAGSPTLEAGRYVAPDIYVGVKQGTSGGGPQATVQIEVAKGLRVDATAGGAQTSATGASSSTEAASIGVSYQFEY